MKERFVLLRSCNGSIDVIARDTNVFNLRFIMLAQFYRSCGVLPTSEHMEEFYARNGELYLDDDNDQNLRKSGNTNWICKTGAFCTDDGWDVTFQIISESELFGEEDAK